MRISAVVLAAGLGTRMKSNIPKVLHKILGKPMIQYIIDTIKSIKPEKLIVVAGKNIKELKEAVSWQNDIIIFVKQTVPKGTGDAALKALPQLKGFTGTVLIVNGDTPLITKSTILNFLALHKKRKNQVSVLSFESKEPSSYGRILRDEKGRVISIVEQRDASEEQKKIKEVNSGIYAIENNALNLLKKIPLNTSKGEYYLTDIIGIAKSKGFKTDAICIGLEEELTGVNTREELNLAANTMRYRIIKKFLESGVTFIDFGSTFISPSAQIGHGTTIYPNVIIEGFTTIGEGCTIYPNVRIVDSEIKDKAIIKDSTLIESSIIKSNAIIGPFAHIRPGSVICENAKIGNFVEVKKSIIGQGTKASHLSYLGDAKIGNDVNIGAGTITCNYDGKNKYITTIEDNVFIGSDTQLVAPVKIGKGAFVGAGSTITVNVPPDSLALSRVEQKNIEGWALKRRLKEKRNSKK
ncbi:MAG: bifunctional UDP-N-acetylglucosamine diphosphorylase/glucosamine-1-phosphate N-acetyltransferase GlmU [Nitrospirae bacterium]|nr:bifunctional UDP-N-acetylglucosamine diphosphorylase/glucosamine-1-phosphate N-acetyltransferase GlmU [Nitrospirota bacterium]